MKGIAQFTGFLFLVVLTSAAIAQDALSIPDYLEQRGIESGSVQIKVDTIAPGLYLLSGSGAGNVVASIGKQGVLIVDDQYPERIPKIRSAIRDLGGGGSRFHHKCSLAL